MRQEFQESQKLNQQQIPHPEKKEISDETYAVKIECELMKRSLMDQNSNEEKLGWINRYAKEYRGLFDANKEQFIKMYSEEPDALYALLKTVLETKETRH